MQLSILHIMGKNIFLLQVKFFSFLARKNLLDAFLEQFWKSVSLF